MPKPINIASTSHAQHLEMQAMFDATGNVAELRKALQDAIAKLDDEISAHAATNQKLQDVSAALEAEQAAHAKAQAALEAATATPPQQ
jgi:hypothetical protein